MEFAKVAVLEFLSYFWFAWVSQKETFSKCRSTIFTGQ